MVMEHTSSTPPPVVMENKKRILIVDDEPHILSVLNSLLGEAYDCRLANGAQEALGYLQQGAYDLILSDIMMPGMSGLELLSSVKQMR
jgi:CheY-like chemotaxis protein